MNYLVSAARLLMIIVLVGMMATGSGTANVINPGGKAQEAISERNWRQHPQIKDIRTLVRNINTRLKKGSYKISKRTFEHCGDGQLFNARRISRDAKGNVPWYEDYSEGQDSSLLFSYYYNRSGSLRFVSGSARHANGTRQTLRIYFENGKRIWTDVEYIKGPGCPGCFGVYRDSDELIAWDAAKAFDAVEGCKEIKPKSRTGQQASTTYPVRLWSEMFERVGVAQVPF
jgi:hypothetical protein